jgi:hypothetical protein
MKCRARRSAARQQCRHDDPPRSGQASKPDPGAAGIARCSRYRLTMMRPLQQAGMIRRRSSFHLLVYFDQMAYSMAGQQPCLAIRPQSQVAKAPHKALRQSALLAMASESSFPCAWTQPQTHSSDYPLCSCCLSSLAPRSIEPPGCSLRHRSFCRNEPGHVQHCRQICVRSLGRVRSRPKVATRVTHAFTPGRHLDPRRPESRPTSEILQDRTRFRTASGHSQVSERNRTACWRRKPRP